LRQRRARIFLFCQPFVVLGFDGGVALTLSHREPIIMSRLILTASLVAVCLIGVLEFRPIQDTDIFWQIRLGEIILDEGRIPQTDRLTYTHAGLSSPPMWWLAQVVFAWLYRVGGWQIPRLVHDLAFAGSLVVAAGTSRRGLATPFSVAIAMTIAFMVMVPNADLRPQSFGLLAFAMLLALARSQRPIWVKLVVAAPLLIVWQNLHPSVILGTIALGALAAADFLDRKGDGGHPWELCILAILPLFLQFATPLGASVLDVSWANLRISRDIVRVGEWLPPWDPTVAWAVSTYWLVLAGTLIASAFCWHRLPWRDRALFIVISLLSFSAARFIIVWAVALVPLWVELIEQLVPRTLFPWARCGADRRVPTVRSMTTLAAAVAIVIGLHPARYGSILRPGIPLDAIGVLRPMLPGPARIYNSRVWAGPLLLEGDPHWRIAVDGRLFNFSDPAEWRTMEAARTGRTSVEEIERTHRPDAFFLYPAGDWALIDKLSSCPRWRVCYRGPTCVAFVPAR
jgi:hypothetical protein